MRQVDAPVVALIASVLLVHGTGCSSAPTRSPSGGGTAVTPGDGSGSGHTPGDDAGVPVSDAGPASDADDGAADTPDGGAPPANQFSCSPAGIAAYADSLVVAARASCTADGTGVVAEDDYTCMQAPINQLNPPHPAASYDVVSTLLAGNVQYPYYECTYFVQTVTAGVCGAPISPPGTAWTDYPLAYTFAGQAIPGYTWIASGQGTVQVGDIPVYQSTYQGDPGHIMIVAAVTDSTHFRLAEANELNSDGSAATMETGVVSNTRIDTIDDSLLAGWFRLSAADAGNP